MGDEDGQQKMGGIEYHLATVHTYESVRRSVGKLDWVNRPDPFRRYEGAPLFFLPMGGLPRIGALAAWSRLGGPNNPAERVDLPLAGSLLRNSLAVNAWKELRGEGRRWPLRVNPSAGNLHPSEIHIFVAGVEGLPEGGYHYRPDLHALEWRLGPEAREAAIEALPTQERPAARRARFLEILTTIPWHQSWKYRSRGFRYCLLDGGHALAALSLSATALGLGARCVTRFADQPLRKALRLEESGAGDEVPLAVLFLTAVGKPVSEGKEKKELFAEKGRANPI